MSPPLLEQLYWSTFAPQNMPLCCASPSWRSWENSSPNASHTRSFIDSILHSPEPLIIDGISASTAIANRFLPLSDFVVEVERKLEVRGETVTQARYFLLTSCKKIDGRDVYVEVHARNACRGVNPRDVKRKQGLEDDWKWCEMHQPKDGKLGRQVTLIRVPKPDTTIKSPVKDVVTREWWKTGDGKDWGTSMLD